MGKTFSVVAPPATAVAFKQNEGITEKNTQAAVLQARMIKRYIDYSLEIISGFTMLHRNPEIRIDGSIDINSDGELFIL